MLSQIYLSLRSIDILDQLNSMICIDTSELMPDDSLTIPCELTLPNRDKNLPLGLVREGSQGKK